MFWVCSNRGDYVAILARLQVVPGKVKASDFKAIVVQCLHGEDMKRHLERVFRTGVRAGDEYGDMGIDVGCASTSTLFQLTLRVLQFEPFKKELQACLLNSYEDACKSATRQFRDMRFIREQKRVLE